MRRNEYSEGKEVTVKRRRNEEGRKRGGQGQKRSARGS